MSNAPRLIYSDLAIENLGPSAILDFKIGLVFHDVSHHAHAALRTAITFTKFELDHPTRS